MQSNKKRVDKKWTNLRKKVEKEGSKQRMRKARARKKAVVLESSLSPSKAFKSPQSFGKAVQRAKRALPNIPRKKQAVIEKLVSKYCVVPKAMAVSPRSTALDPNTIQLVKTFYESDLVSRQLPGKNDFITIKNSCGSKERRQKKTIDGIGGTVKHAMWRKIMQGSAVVTNAAEFASVGKEACPNIVILYLSAADVESDRSALQLRWNENQPKRIPNTHKMHYVRKAGQRSVETSFVSPFSSDVTLTFTKTELFAATTSESDIDSEELDPCNDKIAETKTRGFHIGKFVIIQYDSEKYPGIINNVEAATAEVFVSVMHRCQGGWRWPSIPDETWYAPENVNCVIGTPKPVNNRGVCVENPTCQEIRDVLDAASFQIGVENKLYTRELNKDSVVFRGRVRYQFRNDDGTLVNSKFTTKKEVLIYVAEMIPKLKSRTQNKGSSEQAQNVQAAKKGNKKKRR